MNHRLPLFTRHHPDDILAWRSDGPVSVHRFLAEAHALAARLPAGDWLLNVCSDRYRFAVGFVAGLLAGKTSLQPASQTPGTLADIAARHPGTCCLRDDGFAAAGELPCIDFPELAPSSAHEAAAAEMPEIDAGRIVAILFTSGSTGKPQAQHKTWGRLVANAQAGADRLGLNEAPMNIVATVPAQHSYGFESSFLPAFHGGSPFWAGKPFYPQDVANALAAVPRPRLLVTTPFHLSTLLDAGIPLPGIDVILSATAPLSTKLATRAETRCKAPVMEIYGSTESGQLASRRTTDGPHWTLLAGVSLAQSGDTTTASGRHVEGEVPLGDIIECLPDGRFILTGRHADMINIAGKRTSLAWLNHKLCALPGVRDGAFFLPDVVPERHITRLAACLCAPGMDRTQVLAALRPHIDPAFMPRPLILCDSLPRNTTGKLTRDALQALLTRSKKDV
ncbi:AMP-binding protein [Thauera butanivorans]|uniref:AMP-binding protein n=1 Tax=Thauera butanivorans TaxID=86174 RepID=UPI00083859B7|nr:AMP-binding protein [Thauera butanivorans]